MKKMFQLFSLIFALASCSKDEVITPTSSSNTTILKITGSFKDRKELIKILGPEDDSLKTNLLPYGFVGYIEAPASFYPHKRDWLKEKIVMSNSSKQTLGYGFSYNYNSVTSSYWHYVQGSYVMYIVILFDDNQFTSTNLPYKSLDDVMKDKLIVIEYRDIWEFNNLVGTVSATWKPQ